MNDSAFWAGKGPNDFTRIALAQLCCADIGTTFEDERSLLWTPPGRSSELTRKKEKCSARKGTVLNCSIRNVSRRRDVKR